VQSKRLDIQKRLQDDDLVLWSYKGHSDRLVVSFTGIGPTSGEMPPIEFVKSASHGGRDNVLFVIDPNRTWLNANGLIEKILLHIEDFKQQTKSVVVNTIGHSMGGFAAVIFPAFTKIDVAIGFAPQFSADPSIVGDDDRWRVFRKNIPSFPIRSIAKYLNDTTSYQVFHGRQKREQPQRDRFPVMENLQHHILPGIGHNVPLQLKKHKLLEDVVSLCFQDKKQQVRKALRPLNAYRRNLADNPILAPVRSAS